MSEHDYQLILKAIEQTCNAHNEGTRGILASIDANATVTNNELMGIRKHLGRLNGTVGGLQTESEVRKKIIDEFHEHVNHGEHKSWRWVKKNWWVVLLAFIGAVILVVTIYEVIGFRGIVDVVKEIR